MHLAGKEISDTGARMGRPPLGKSADDTKTTLVRLEASVRARIEVVRGGVSMAAFIRQAILEKLDREAQCPPVRDEPGC